MKKLLLLLSLITGGACGAVAATNQLESLTLEQALEIAERQNPQLAEAHALVEAAAGRAQQAGALPNPEAIVGAQQLPFNSDQSNQREYIAGIAQSIPLGARLGKAREAELMEREVRARGLEVMRRDLRKRVQSAFATALYQDEALRAQSRIAESYEKAVATTKARVEAGDAINEDLARVAMESMRFKVELQRARAMRDQSRLALAGAMGDARLVVNSMSGSLANAFELPTLETLADSLAAQPELRQAEASVRASEARIALAKAERIPDVKVEALYHRLEATEENTFDIGLSIPLPLFNRNQGNLREARAETTAAEARLRTTESEHYLRLSESYAQLTIAIAKNKTFTTEILPRAETVMKAAEARYAAGETSLTDLLPVRREWAAIQLSHLESIRDAIQAWGELSGYLKSL